jgi:hypothetical protein
VKKKIADLVFYRIKINIRGVWGLDWIKFGHIFYLTQSNLIGLDRIKIKIGILYIKPKPSDMGQGVIQFKFLINFQKMYTLVTIFYLETIFFTEIFENNSNNHTI